MSPLAQFLYFRPLTSFIKTSSCTNPFPESRGSWHHWTSEGSHPDLVRICPAFACFPFRPVCFSSWTRMRLQTLRVFRHQRLWWPRLSPRGIIVVTLLSAWFCPCKIAGARLRVQKICHCIKYNVPCHWYSQGLQENRVKRSNGAQSNQVFSSPVLNPILLSVQNYPWWRITQHECQPCSPSTSCISTKLRVKNACHLLTIAESLDRKLRCSSEVIKKAERQ